MGVSLGRQYQIVGLLEAVAVAEEDLLDELFAVSLETSLLSEEKTMTTSPVNNSEYNNNDNDNYNAVAVAEEDLLGGLFAVSLETSILPEQGTTTTSQVNNSEYNSNDNYNDVYDISLQKSLAGKSY